MSACNIRNVSVSGHRQEINYERKYERPCFQASSWKISLPINWTYLKWDMYGDKMALWVGQEPMRPLRCRQVFAPDNCRVIGVIQLSGYRIFPLLETRSLHVKAINLRTPQTRKVTDWRNLKAALHYNNHNCISPRQQSAQLFGVLLLKKTQKHTTKFAN